MKIWRLLQPWLVRRWLGLSGALLLALIAVAAGVGLLSVAGWFLTGAFLAGALIGFNLFGPSALIRGLSFLRIGSRYVERVVGHAATLDLLADMRTAVFGRIMRLSPVQLSRYQEGDLVSRLVSDVDTLDTVFLLVVAPILTALIIGAAFSLLVGIYVPLVAWVVFSALMTGICLIPYCLARWSHASGARAQQAAADARALIHDVVAGHADLAVFGAQPQAQAQFHAAVHDLSQARDRLSAIGSAGQLGQQWVVGVSLLALLWSGLLAFHAGALSGPVWAGLLLGAISLFEVLSPLMRGASRLGATAAAAARIRELSDAEPALREPEVAIKLPESGPIEFLGVGYRYPAGSSGHAALNNVNLRIDAGERVAIVGASGSGKSTLLSLLMRIFDPTDGRILYGGVPIKEVNTSDLHTRFTLLSQNSPVFLGTLRSNLLIGNPHATDAQLWEALEFAHLADFVRSLGDGGVNERTMNDRIANDRITNSGVTIERAGDGLDTWVGEAGRSLSVGQARRLCLARALLTSATVWLLDEPTAGLDEETQAAFFADLSLAARGRTVILVTHAEFSAGTVDRVLRLCNGTLIV